MADITLKGNAIKTNGELPAVGSKAPAFKLTTKSLEDVGLEAFAGKKKVITINPSLDTGVCQITTRAFNEKAGSLDGTVVLSVTSDLPFAAKRFCEAEGLNDVEILTLMRDRKFAEDYGVLIENGPMAGLVARAPFYDLARLVGFLARHRRVELATESGVQDDSDSDEETELDYYCRGLHPADAMCWTGSRFGMGQGLALTGHHGPQADGPSPGREAPHLCQRIMSRHQ